MVVWLLHGCTGHDSDISVRLDVDASWCCFGLRVWGHRVRLRRSVMRGCKTDDRASLELRARFAGELEKPR
jgi:hypothetical protein